MSLSKSKEINRLLDRIATRNKLSLEVNLELRKLKSEVDILLTKTQKKLEKESFN